MGVMSSWGDVVGLAFENMSVAAADVIFGGKRRRRRGDGTVGRVGAMTSPRGPAPPQVSFDATKHLSEASIRRRQLERQKLQELELQREEQKRREREAEERRRAEER